MFRKLLTVTVLAIIGLTSGFSLGAVLAKQDDTPKKVFVCKYVGTPGVDERLQTGNNPISVSINAIQNNQWDGTVPGWFSDAHDRSYVLEYDTGQAEPSVDKCPKPDVPEDPPEENEEQPKPETEETPSVATPQVNNPKEIFGK